MRLALLLVLTSLLALPACRTESRTAVQAVDPPPPLLDVSTVYEAAIRYELPPLPAHEYPGLANVYALSASIVSGGEPLEAASFDHLAKWGVRTIISVDGKAPDADAAESRGMRYVHIPLRYSGMSNLQIEQLTKTFRELEAPFYVHCYHGVHRGPAAAALGRVVRDGASREQAMAEMRQWCRTAAKYEALYTTIASADLPSLAASTAFPFDFPSTKPAPTGLRSSMVELTRVHDDLKLLSKHAWLTDPMHPDIDAFRSAEQLAAFFRGANALSEVRAGPSDQREWMGAAVAATADLVEALRILRDGPESAGEALEGVAREEAMRAATSRADEAFGRVKESCATCHAPYRNR
jgi:protein tyrosine phosphatase (PTP) superfamily phosphohydrolase (DUF442 family)